MSALRHERRAAHVGWSVVFGVAGIGLLPWIGLLYVEQPPVADVGGLPLAAGAAVGAIAVGLVATAVLGLLGSAVRVVAASATAALALCAGFFHVVTGTASEPRAAAVVTVIVLGPVALLCAGIARHDVRAGWSPRSRAPSRTLAAALAVAALAAVVVWVRSPSASYSAASAHHLKLAWTVLDVAEAAALLATAATLWWRPHQVPVAASAAGTLLCCDVWFNVVGAVGEARTEAVQLAFVSVPLAIAAFVVGVREVHADVRSTS